MDMRLSGEATSNRALQPGRDALPSSLRYAAASPRVPQYPSANVRCITHPFSGSKTNVRDREHRVPTMIEVRARSARAGCPLPIHRPRRTSAVKSKSKNPHSPFFILHSAFYLICPGQLGTGKAEVAVHADAQFSTAAG